MSEKRKQVKYEPYGLLGRAFHYTRDDLNANRAGYITLAQQFAFKFWERKLYSGLLTLPPFKWFISNNRREAYKVVGAVEKHYHSKIIYTGSGGTGGGHQDVLEQRRIQVMAQDETVTFYVNEKQYNSLPENIEMTLYYDKLENRILSVEPPYDEE